MDRMTENVTVQDVLEAFKRFPKSDDYDLFSTEDVDRYIHDIQKQKKKTERLVSALAQNLLAEEASPRIEFFKPLNIAKQNKIVKALAKGKEHNYIADPTNFSYAFLVKRLQDEVKEFEAEAIATGDKHQLLLELADIANFVDFLYCKIQGVPYLKIFSRTFDGKIMVDRKQLEIRIERLEESQNIWYREDTEGRIEQLKEILKGKFSGASELKKETKLKT